MSARPRRAQTPSLVRLVVALVRTVVDLLDLILRSVAWLLEHVCDILEAISMRLHDKPKPPPSAPRAIRPEAKELTTLDKFARELWGTSRTKPSPQTYKLAESLLNSANGRTHG